VSAVHQISDAARVQMSRNVRVMQRESVLAEVAAISPGGGCVEREVRGRLSR
jgi:Ni,Fe-hydrogenase III component G